MRMTIDIPEGGVRIIDRFLSFNLGGVTIPVGLILIFAIICYLLWLFLCRENALETVVTKGKYTIFAAIISTAICSLLSRCFAKSLS